jgi:predicted RNA binding protein YcfA (HicA-like mRNA interferase family)
MKSSELVRIANKYGWTLSEQDGTSHRAYEKEGEKVIIPFHGSKEVPTGTCRSILRKIKGNNK